MADKGTTTVIMNEQGKIREGQILLDEKEKYKLLSSPVALETSQKAKEIINALHHGDHIDVMTKKWLSLTPNPPQIPVFYNLTKIHKPNPVGRPINSGCEGPTEGISSFVDHLLHPIAKIQKSYLKDTTDFLNFIEKTKVAKDTILVLRANVGIYRESQISSQKSNFDLYPPNNSLEWLFQKMILRNPQALYIWRILEKFENS